MECLICLLMLLGAVGLSEPLEVDPNGYIMYCPCMGRFGNQADHFLGVLGFANGINRTLVLPPWVEYPPMSRTSKQVPFNTYFRVAPLEDYHRVILMEQFMEELAPVIWPEGKRTVFCYSFRTGGNKNDCNAKEGNPFGPFWDTFNINFDRSESYGPLYYDVNSNPAGASEWNNRFPAEKYPVLAFTGAPANFPVTEHDVPLQIHMEWSKTIVQKASNFIRENLPFPFLGIHLRNGVDWKNACTHIGKRHLFGSPQCLGYHFEHGNEVTSQMCFPSDDLVVKQVVRMVKKTKVKGLFIATDDRDLMDKFQKVLKIRIIKYSPSEPHVDLAILEKADYHIGNCISTFSSFAIRARRVRGKPVTFWGFEPKQMKDEL